MAAVMMAPWRALPPEGRNLRPREAAKTMTINTTKRVFRARRLWWKQLRWG